MRLVRLHPLVVLLNKKAMTSVKCRSCGLVNFSTVPSCKRCKSPLAGSASSQDQFGSFHSPPPPPIFHGDSTVLANVSAGSHAPPCLKCGSRDRITVRNFVKIYNSPVAILGIFLGLLPYFLLKLLLRTKHHLTGPFCEKCWATVKNLRAYEVANSLLFFPILIGGIVFSVFMQNDLILMGSLLFSLFVLAAGSYYLSTLGPKYKRLNSKEAVIDAPFVGEIVYTR